MSCEDKGVDTFYEKTYISDDGDLERVGWPICHTGEYRTPNPSHPWR